MAQIDQRKLDAATPPIGGLAWWLRGRYAIAHERARAA